MNSHVFLSFPAISWKFADLFFSCARSFFPEPPDGVPENEIREKYGLPYVLSANLGRTALKTGLKALPFPGNTEILIPDIVCPTVIYTILKAGYRPVLCDVERDLHVSVRTTAEICDKKNIRIILVPHLYGLNAPIDEIQNWCRDSGIFLIDDAAQAVGLKHKQQYLGTFGDMGLLSFGPYKNIGISRGGFLLLKDQQLYLRAKKQKLKSESKISVFRRIASCLVKLRYGRSLFLTLQEMKKRKNSNTNEKKIAARTSETYLLPREEDYALSDVEARLIHLTLRRQMPFFQNGQNQPAVL
ncbi:MAG: DegT/DnrJ/EryC1/StrS family aminotransferase [Desulfobacterales bacterium]